METRKKRYGTGGATPGNRETKSGKRVGSGTGDSQSNNKVPRSDSGNTYTTKYTEG